MMIKFLRSVVNQKHPQLQMKEKFSKNFSKFLIFLTIKNLKRKVSKQKKRKRNYKLTTTPLFKMYLMRPVLKNYNSMLFRQMI